MVACILKLFKSWRHMWHDMAPNPPTQSLNKVGMRAFGSCHLLLMISAFFLCYPHEIVGDDAHKSTIKVHVPNLVTWLDYMYLNGVWSCLNSRMDTNEMCVQKRLDYMNHMAGLRGLTWSRLCNILRSVVNIAPIHSRPTCSNFQTQFPFQLQCDFCISDYCFTASS